MPPRELGQCSVSNFSTSAPIGYLVHLTRIFVLVV
jgi:hypothetical protein